MRGDRIVATFLVVLAIGCQKAENHDDQKVVDQTKSPGTGPGPLTKPRTEQVPPPFDLKTPPADANKTASGLVYKKEVTNDAGEAPKRNDTVMINYTGWKPSTGETFYTNRSRGQPMPLNLSTTAPGFTEGLQLLKKGEKAVFWIPPSIGYKGSPQGTPETLVYEFELVDVQAAPPVPADVAKPPDNAESTKSGIKFVVVRPGTGKDKAKSYDNVTFNYTAWDADGRMFDTTEMMRKKAAKSAPYRQASAFQDMLTDMTAGERVRFWVDAEKMQQDGKPVPGMPKGQLCYEAEIVQIEPGVAPPTTPPDVAKPPSDAKKTAKGVFYKVLKEHACGADAAKCAAEHPHPKTSDTVRVHYTGWTTDGKMFDSSVVRNEPSEFSLQGVIAGWTDGIPQMSVGDKFRFWIPEELAYKGQPGRPQGMLVFDVELLEIKAGGPPHSPMPPHHP